MIVVRAVGQIPSKVTISGPVLLLAELIVWGGGDDTPTAKANGGAFANGTFASFERHRKILL
jgi:hypothetical protein